MYLVRISPWFSYVFKTCLYEVLIFRSFFNLHTNIIYIKILYIDMKYFIYNGVFEIILIFKVRKHWITYALKLISQIDLSFVLEQIIILYHIILDYNKYFKSILRLILLSTWKLLSDLCYNLVTNPILSDFGTNSISPTFPSPQPFALIFLLLNS